MSIVASILLNLSVSYQLVELLLTFLLIDLLSGSLIDLLSGSLINALSITLIDLLSTFLVNFVVNFLVDFIFDTWIISLIDGTSVLSLYLVLFLFYTSKLTYYHVY